MTGAFEYSAEHIVTVDCCGCCGEVQLNGSVDGETSHPFKRDTRPRGKFEMAQRVPLSTTEIELQDFVAEIIRFRRIGGVAVRSKAERGAKGRADRGGQWMARVFRWPLL